MRDINVQRPSDAMCFILHCERFEGVGLCMFTCAGLGFSDSLKFIVALYNRDMGDTMADSIFDISNCHLLADN